MNAPVDVLAVDWYERRADLHEGMVFACRDGTVVRIERRVPGDGTKWVVADWSGGSWGHYENEIEPGDLVGKPGCCVDCPSVIAALARVQGGQS